MGITMKWKELIKAFMMICNNTDILMTKITNVLIASSALQKQNAVPDTARYYILPLQGRATICAKKFSIS